jgi:hypothetical protein
MAEAMQSESVRAQLRLERLAAMSWQALDHKRTSFVIHRLRCPERSDSARQGPCMVRWGVVLNEPPPVGVL